MGLKENIVAFSVGVECLKICVVDAFVYESAVEADSLGLLNRFCRISVNFLEVSL
jgi:hypothetical protein